MAPHTKWRTNFYECIADLSGSAATPAPGDTADLIAALSTESVPAAPLLQTTQYQAAAR